MEYTLNFTDQHALRELRSGSMDGNFSTKAKDTLQKQQETFPKVFGIPIYPVDHSGLDVQFDYEIELKNESKLLP